MVLLFLCNDNGRGLTSVMLEVLFGQCTELGVCSIINGQCPSLAISTQAR